MFQRSRLDHFGLLAPDREAFWTLHQRVLTAGAGTGEVTDFGPMWSFSFTDPDGMAAEVLWLRPDADCAQVRCRARWTKVVPPALQGDQGE